VCCGTGGEKSKRKKTRTTEEKKSKKNGVPKRSSHGQRTLQGEWRGEKKGVEPGWHALRGGPLKKGWPQGKIRASPPKEGGGYQSQLTSRRRRSHPQKKQGECFRIGETARRKIRLRNESRNATRGGKRGVGKKKVKKRRGGERKPAVLRVKKGTFGGRVRFAGERSSNKLMKMGATGGCWGGGVNGPPGKKGGALGETVRAK